MEIKYKKDRQILTVYISGELDECSASHAKTILDKVLQENYNSSKVVFDLSELVFMDSTGIGLLIGRYKMLNRLHVPSFISGASLSAEKVLELSGIYNIMPKI